QVLCQACGSRHSYRTGPARKRASEGFSEATSGRTQAPDRDAIRKAEVMRALTEEVASAATVRVFNPKERYKAGEIISDPEYGGGTREDNAQGTGQRVAQPQPQRDHAGGAHGRLLQPRPFFHRIGSQGHGLSGGDEQRDDIAPPVLPSPVVILANGRLQEGLV